MKNRKKKIRKSWGDRLFLGFSTLVLLVILIAVAYPIIYVISASFSSATALSAGRVLLWPIEPTIAGYKFIMQYKMVWVGYRNSIIYTIFGVAFSMSLTLFGAYALSKKAFPGKTTLTMIFFITMMFNAGLIPTFLVYSKLGLYGNPIAVIISSALSMGNILIMRTAFQSVPDELWEAAEIDGASQFRRFVFVGLPLTKATIGVLTLYCVVGSWNDYFNAMIYLTESEQYPLQMVLRTILTAAQSLDLTSVSGSAMLAMAQSGAEQVKYALIVVATVPILAVYGVVQKGFKGGVMIGAVKG